MSKTQPERSITLREVNQAFAHFIREVEGGAAFTITRNGHPVARLAPVEVAPRRLSPEQESARLRTRARMQEGWPLGASPIDRDELHES